MTMGIDLGSVAEWVAAIAAVAAIAVAGIALWHSSRIDELNSRLLHRQIGAEYVYWHVHADRENKRFVFRNIGTSTAHDVTAHVFIEGTEHIESQQLGDCGNGETLVMPSTTFLTERTGVVSQYYAMYAYNRAIKADTNPMTVQVLVEWRDSLGFNDHQQIGIRYH